MASSLPRRSSIRRRSSLAIAKLPSAGNANAGGAPVTATGRRGSVEGGFNAMPRDRRLSLVAHLQKSKDRVAAVTAGARKKPLNNDLNVRRVLLTVPDLRTTEDIDFLMEYTTNVKFFDDLSTEIRRRVLTYMSFRSVEKNVPVIVQGETGDEFYILMSGSVAVCHRENAESK